MEAFILFAKRAYEGCPGGAAESGYHTSDMFSAVYFNGLIFSSDTMKLTNNLIRI